jgi:hypothetical protein
LDVGLDKLLQRLDEDTFWLGYFAAAVKPTSSIGIHLAIFAEPFLSLVLDGKKTIESRFSRNRCAPYGEIDDGDIILIKEVAGPICAVTLANRTWCYDLARDPIEPIRRRFATGVCADEDFWSARSDALYATFIELTATTEIAPLQCDKRDRRGWVALRTRQQMFSF